MDAVLPEAVSQALTSFLLQQRRVAPGLVARAIVTGSAVRGDWLDGTSDIDVVFVVTRDPKDDLEALAELHARTEPRIDGVYLTESQLAKGPETVQTAPQVMEGVLVSALEGNQLNWLTWREVETGVQGVVDGGDIIWSPTADRHPDTAEGLVASSKDTLLDYWKPIGDAAEEELSSRSDASPVRPQTVQWVVLGPARLLAAIETGDVLSKKEAAAYVGRRWPEYSELIDKVVRHRSGEYQTFTTAEGRQAIALLRACVEAGVAAGAP